MQVLNFPQTQPAVIANQKLLALLQDISSQVEIKSNFCIHHPEYKPLLVHCYS